MFHGRSSTNTRYGDATIADGAHDFPTIVLFHLVIFLEWMTRRFSDLLKN